ncbi:RmlC-like cupin domain-containing protein [Calycina marina]|uniref:Cysteine dioxygenase n=1 Tax=Calycina marina TaxID=1763456 RepID=A0A9P7YWV0_9HELO|nr:RmlC-like cupin domain-containing protein [Calycina marina]
MNPFRTMLCRAAHWNLAALRTVEVSRSIASTARKATSLEVVRGRELEYVPQHFHPRTTSLTQHLHRPVLNGFTTLFTDLTHALTRPGPPPTILELERIMSSYTSLPTEWSRYAHADPSKLYTRNLVLEVPGVFNLLLLAWTPGKSSAIHDHVDSHCVMRILSGSILEKRYAWPSSPSGPSTSKRMQLTSSTTHAADAVAYINDAHGLHSVHNPSAHETAYSLHLYTPPNAAMRGCYTFDESTGERVHVRPGRYDSIGGCQ